MQYRYQVPLPVPPSRPQFDNSAESDLTLFDAELGLVVIDEAAKLRNLNRQWTVVHELVSTAQCGIAMTATPIHNGPAVCMRTVSVYVNASGAHADGARISSISAWL